MLKNIFGTIALVQVDSEAMFVGKAAIANLLGGIGYFYGQSKIALPKGFTVSKSSYNPFRSLILSVCFCLLGITC